MLQFEEFRLVNQKALELFGLETIETLQSAIFAAFYCGYYVLTSPMGILSKKQTAVEVYNQNSAHKGQNQKILSESRRERN